MWGFYSSLLTESVSIGYSRVSNGSMFPPHYRQQHTIVRIRTYSSPDHRRLYTRHPPAFLTDFDSIYTQLHLIPTAVANGFVQRSPVPTVHFQSVACLFGFSKDSGMVWEFPFFLRGWFDGMKYKLKKHISKGRFLTASAFKPQNDYLSIPFSKIPDISRKIAVSTLRFRLLSLVFALIRQNKGKLFLFTQKAIEVKIESSEHKISDLKDRISRMVREYGYPDGQAFMAAYNKAESIVKRYEWELAEWKQQVEGKPAEEKKPPERKSVVAQLHRIRDEAQKPPKRSYRDRDER